jgi:hypothetical protein
MPDGTIVRPYGPHQVVGQIPKGLASYVFDVPLFGLPVYGASPLTGIVLIREKA